MVSSCAYPVLCPGTSGLVLGDRCIVCACTVHSDKLERLVKKAARNESKGGQDAAAAALRQELALSHTAQQDLEDALKSAQTQERRLHKENVALQERLLQVGPPLSPSPLPAPFWNSSPPRTHTHTHTHMHTEDRTGERIPE